MGYVSMNESFTITELRAVVRWLDAREHWLRTERLIMECGDDFAISRGRGPAINKLADEESAARVSKVTAQDQLAQAAAKEPPWRTCERRRAGDTP